MDFMEIHTQNRGNPYVSCCERFCEAIDLLRIQKQKVWHRAK